MHGWPKTIGLVSQMYLWEQGSHFFGDTKFHVFSGYFHVNMVSYHSVGADNVDMTKIFTTFL